MLMVAAAPNKSSITDLTKHVLLVEDDIALGDVIEEILVDTMLMHVTRSYTADEAFDRLQHDPRSFDMVMSDIVMPGTMSGVDLARRLRRDYPKLPILLCTGNAPPKDLKGSENFPLIRKPFRLQELRDMISRLGMSL